MHRNRHRVLVIGKSSELKNELVTLLSGYGYFVDHTPTRVEGIRRFRAHKQSIIIIDARVLRTFPARMFRLIHRVQRFAVVLIAARKDEEEAAFSYLRFGAYDVLSLPFKLESLLQTLGRAREHHRLMLENLFVKNLVFFALLLLPVWLLTGYVLLR